MVLDQTTDISGQETVRILRSYQFPDFVKTAELDKICGSGSNDLSDYADPQNRQFPINSPEAVCLSAAFLFEQANSIAKEEYDKIYNRLIKAAKIYNVEKEVEDLHQQIRKADPTADLPDEYFGYIDKDGNRRYPLRTEEEVKVAADYFIQHCKQMPWEMRNCFAERILKAAERLKVSLGFQKNSLLKSAGQGVCGPEEIKEEIRRRIVWSKNTPEAEGIDELLTKVMEEMEKSAGDIEDIKSLVHFLDKLDRKFGWIDLPDYDHLPEEKLFWVTEKVAKEALEDIVENPVIGVVYSLNEIIANIPTEDIKRAIGQSAFQKAANDFGKLDASKLSSVLANERVGKAFHVLIKAYKVPIIGTIKSAISVAKELGKI